MYPSLYRLYSVCISANGSINIYKPVTRFRITNIRSPYHIAYGGIDEGIYRKT